MERTLHILQSTPYYAPAYAFGGVVRAVEGLSRALVALGHRVTVLTSDALNQTARYDGLDEELRDGVRVVRVRNLSIRLRGRYNLSTPKGLSKIAESLLEDVDIVHCHEFRTVENILLTPVAEKLALPMVLSPHGTLTYNTGRSRSKAIWDKLFSPQIARRFDHIVALTQDELQQVQTLWPSFGRRRIPAGFSVIPNGVHLADFTHLPDATLFRRQWGLGDGLVILFMGRLHARKGVDKLLQAFTQIDMPQSRLLIVGPDEGMLETARTLADNRVIFTGYLEGQDRLAALSAADIFTLPAVGEGLSMAALEAMACGLPVLLSPGCNLPEVVEYRAGIITEPQIDLLTEALNTLLSDAALHQQMGRAARQLVEDRFTWEQVARQYINLYRTLVAQKAQSTEDFTG